MVKYFHLQSGDLVNEGYNMFGEISGSLADLSADQRSRLAELLVARNAYNEKLLVLNQMRIAELRNPTPENEERSRDFASAVIAPLRSEMVKLQGKLFEESIDLDGLKSMLPMILLAASQSINLPLLLTTAGVEPDAIDALVGLAKDYFRDGTI